jgi:hypothetical protein
VTICVVLLSCGAFARAQEPGDGTAKFDAEIAPLLARRCLECHSSTEKQGGLDLTRRALALAGGDSGQPALAPGRPEESYLLQRIVAEEMPPEHPLPQDERERLRQWIADGAAWGTEPIDPLRYSSDVRAGYDWWSLQPVRRPEPPAATAAQQGWPRNAIDHFVLVELDRADLAPSPEADRRALVRRLSFDLLGLPPTPGEVEAFVADTADNAYERLVDRLLDSPHYGERWARHWLDVIRFGESQGFERDKLRAAAWPYRDWVVLALNDDLPYDEFVRLQLAGDVLRPDDPLAVAATGFLVAGAYDEVGQTQQSAAMRAVVREDELEDIVAVVGQAFLGLTVNCARCHDHKFDPISAKEYYQLTAALAGVRHGERERLSDAGRAAAQDLRRPLDEQSADLERQLAELTSPVRERLVAQRQASPPSVAPPQPIARWEFDGDLNDALGGLHGTAHGAARVERGRLVLDGSSWVETAPLAGALEAKTLEAWVALTNVQQQGGGAISVQSLDGGVFDAIVFGEREAGQWMAGSNGFVRTASFQAPAETAPATELVHMAIVYQADGTITGYRNGVPYGQPYQSVGLQAYQAAGAQVLFGLRHAPAGGNRHLTGEIEQAALYDRALEAEEVAASAGVPVQTVNDDEVIAALDADARRQFDELTLELSRVQVRARLLGGGPTYAVSPTQPDLRQILHRGNPAQPGKLVQPGGLACVQGVSADFDLATDAPEADRRARLASWIADANNPLAARVMVNRLWHYHFGQGLVATPNDFGFNGGLPSHPELLDYLAAELVAGGWRLKPLHRLIVTSATYRQAATFREEAAVIDADNRLLWRKSPTRLEAEAVRDAMLAVAGELNPAMGGPGYQDFRTFTFNSQFYEPVDAPGRTFARRSLYRTWVRSGTNPLLDVLDCPDPATTTPRRAVTTTPLQALSLLNDSFVLRMADSFAARLQRECGPAADEAALIRRGYAVAYGRPPDADELSDAVEFVRVHGLPAFCRVMFNANEFLYVD